MSYHNLDFSTDVTPVIVDGMTVYPVEDFYRMTLLSGELYKAFFQAGYRNNVLPVGRTQAGVYATARINHDLQLTHAFRNTTYIQLDDYLGLSPRSHYHHSLYSRIRKNLLDPIGHEDEKRIRFDLKLPVETAIEFMEEDIEEIGGIDLSLLGMGDKGHIGFNERGTAFHTTTHIAELDDATKEQNKKMFGKKGKCPDQAVTLGHSNIFNGRAAMAMIAGKKKADTMKKFLQGDITEDVPITNLRLMAQAGKPVIIVADRAALSRCDI
ncbi:MAG: 6-phosphogluconolactonase [Pseudomonadota bacterium]